MERLDANHVDRALTHPDSEVLTKLLGSDVMDDYPAALSKKTEKKTTELAITVIEARNLTDDYVERVEVRSNTCFGEKRHLGTDFRRKSEYPFKSSFRHPIGSELLIAAKKNKKVYFTRVRVTQDTAININVQKGGISAEVYSFDSKKDFRARETRELQDSLVLNECSARSIDGIHLLM